MKLFKLLALSGLLLLFSCKKEAAVGTAENTPENMRLKDLQKMSVTTMPNATLISGIVISDRNGGNIDAKTLVLQDNDGNGFTVDGRYGIVLSFDQAHPYEPGDKIEVNVSNLPFSNQEGNMNIKNIPLKNALKTGTGTILPQSVSIADFQKNKSKYLNILVSLNKGTFKGDGKFTGTITYNDGTGNLPLPVMKGAAFESQDYPEQVEELKAILIVNNDNSPRIYLPNLKSVTRQGGVTTVITDNMDKWITAYAYGYQNTYIGMFTTPYMESAEGDWFALDGAKGADASFTEAGRKYLYVRYGNLDAWARNSFVLSPYKLPFEQLRTVTITFAGSKLGLKDLLPGQTKDDFNAYQDVSPGDYILLKSSYSTSEKEYIFLTSEKYYDTGIWHTITINVPSKSGLKAMGISDDEIADFYANAKVRIYNISKRKKLSSKGYSSWFSDDHSIYYGTDVPILISKIEFGYADQ